MLSCFKEKQAPMVNCAPLRESPYDKGPKQLLEHITRFLKPGANKLWVRACFNRNCPAKAGLPNFIVFMPDIQLHQSLKHQFATRKEFIFER